MPAGRVVHRSRSKSVGKRGLYDLASEKILDAFEAALVLVIHQGNREAGALRPGRSPDAMHLLLRSAGHVTTYNNGDDFNDNAPGQYNRSHEHLCFTGRKIAEHVLALFLFEIGMNGLDG